MDALPIQKGGLAVPCIRTELMTMAVEATVSLRDLLIGDFLWGSSESVPVYIMPCWTIDTHPRYRATLWLNGFTVLGIQRLDMNV